MMRCEMRGGKCQNETDEKISGVWVCAECDAHIASTLRGIALELAELPKLLDTSWIMVTADGCYPIQPSERCKPEDYGAPNPHVIRIEDEDGRTIWRRDH